MTLSLFLCWAVSALLVTQAERDEGLAAELAGGDVAASGREGAEATVALNATQAERDEGLAGELTTGDVAPCRRGSAEATVALNVTQAEGDEGLAGELTTGDMAPCQRGSAEEDAGEEDAGEEDAGEEDAGEEAPQRALVEVNKHGAAIRKGLPGLPKDFDLRQMLCDQVTRFVDAVKANQTCFNTARDAVGNPATAGSAVDYGLDLAGEDTMVMDFLKDLPLVSDALVGKTIWSLVWNGAKLWQELVCTNVKMSACKRSHAMIKVSLAIMAFVGMVGVITVPFVAAVPIALFSWLMTHGLTDLCDYFENGYKKEGWPGVWKHTVELFPTELFQKAVNASKNAKEAMKLKYLKMLPGKILSILKRTASRFFQMMFGCLKLLWEFLEQKAHQFGEVLGSAAKAVKDAAIKTATVAGEGAKAGAQAAKKGAKAGAEAAKKGADAAKKGAKAAASQTATAAKRATNAVTSVAKVGRDSTSKTKT